MTRVFRHILSLLLLGMICLAGSTCFGKSMAARIGHQQKQEKPGPEPPLPEQVEKQTPKQPEQSAPQKPAPQKPAPQKPAPTVQKQAPAEPPPPVPQQTISPAPERPQEESSQPRSENPADERPANESPAETQQPEPPAAQPQTQTQPAEPPALEPEPQTQPTVARPEPKDGEVEGIQKKIVEEIEKLTGSFSFRAIILALLTLGFFYLVHKALVLVLNRIAGRRKDQTLWLRRAIPFVSFGWWFLAITAVVGIFANSAAAIVVLLVLAAVALIFSSQQLLRDIISGMVILLERPFQIGDRIKIGNHQGEVLRIGLRAFHLLSPDGSVVAIPNSDVARSPVSNSNSGAIESQVTTELLLPADIDIEEGKRIAYEAVAISPYVYINKPIEVQVDEEYRNEPVTKLVVTAYVFDVQYERELRSDTIERARKGFQKRVKPAELIRDA